MKKTLFMIIVSFCILSIPIVLTSNFAKAAGWSGGSADSNWTTVIEVWAVNNGSILVKAANMDNPETTCTDNEWFQVPPDNIIADRIYSTLLMALAAQKEVKFFFSGGCYENRPRIQHIKIK